ncbi:CXXC-rich protein [Entamoeba nuttalli P19]|uniref:CXXC-rich protein n=1 Tax=Entamoeba nuttalli (strain P19) TaxID=1076696 RepID=K2H6D5_ENTNP|nr:CXXC-rich protein [Entamoeba nuttalli P19]EKE42052.1 CXXC-rich protein [Entamoeba nuttalli P19]|eukprot:XP_008855614.1 CXXC-rich protein [Entamoeba nuttalli P19]
MSTTKLIFIALIIVSCIAENFIRFPYPGLPSTDIDGKKEYAIFRKKQQAYLLINMLRVDPQAFVEKYMKPVIADDSWRLLFKTESIRLKKFPDYYPLYQDALLEQTASHARLGESFANVRSRLKSKLPEKLDGFIPGYKPLKLLAQTLMWKTKTQNDFFSYLCHGTYQDIQHCGKKDLVLAGCKPDYINRKTPRGRIRFLLRPSGAVGCNTVNTLVKDENLFACDVTYPDFSPRLRIKSPMIAGNWFNTGIGNSRIYAVVIHVPQHEKVSKVELIIDGKMIELPLAYQNGVTHVYSIAYTPLKHIPSLMKGYFFHAVINGKNFFYPAQYYYDWEENIKLNIKQRYNGFCKIPFPDRTCDVCDEGYRNVNGTCVRCPFENCAECTADVCTKCSKGHLLSYGTCTTPCIEHCDVCSYSTTCDKCAPTHFLNAINGTCVECSEKFQDCATCTNEKCLTYMCQYTDPTCNMKKTPGQYFSEITQKCEKCSEGCKSCTYDQFRGSKCLVCNNGLFLTEEGECIPCHYVDGCAPGQCDGIKCLRCKRGYYPSGKGCIKCDETCAQCTTNGTCVACAYGYWLDPEYGKCVESYEVENCERKNAHGVCSKCKEGFGFDKYHKCVACDASCKKCFFADKCEECKETFYNDKGHCIPCSRRGCDLCDANECFSCQPNSYLHNGVCVRGPPGCSLCHDKAPICKVCEKGMKMENGHCVPDCDIKNCAKCNGDETCRYCKSTLNPFYGYEPAPNGTDPCPFVCDPVELNCLLTEKMKRGEVDACFSLGCKYCPPHTFRRHHKCIKCAVGCAHCLNEKECIKCLPGYSYYMGECFQCNKNGTCGEGEYMEGCTCTSCEKKFPHCSACDKDQCIDCEPHFILSENKTSCVPCTKKTCPPPPPPPCRGKDCERPHHPDCDGDDCPKPEPTPDPTPDPDVPVPQECNATANFSRIGDSYVFDPMCVKKDADCYCTECACGYELSITNHTCVEVSEEKKLNLCCNTEDGCCTSCQPGYKLNGCKCVKDCKCGENDDGTCKEIVGIENCKTVGCDNICQECLEGYYLNGTTCDKCMDNCTHCKNNNTCTQCQEGYYLNETTLLCDRCKNCSGICDSTGLVCESCAPGQYLNETTGECESCIGCERCVVNDNVVYCTLCADGSVPVDGYCAKSTTFARSGVNGISVILAMVMMIALIL